MKSRWILTTAFAAALSLAGLGMAQTPAAGTAAGTADQTKTSMKTKATKTVAAPTAQEIADAKAKGMVWVNTSSKVYHKDGQYYGATKHGKFMAEADAQKAGYKPAQEPAAKKTKSTAKSSK